MERIEGAALDLFADFGYHATSMRKLAGIADIQAGTLYHWYPNKEALLVSIMQKFLGGLTREVVSAVDEKVSASDRLAAAVRAHVIYHGLHRRAAFVTDTEVRALTGTDRLQILTTRDNYEQMFYQLIRDGMEQGTLDCRDPKIATLAVLLQCTGVAIWFDPAGSMSLSEIADVHVDLVLKSLNGSR
ncbi:MAG: TetR family transcriptional regulator [Thermoleophilia bacterium]|nr:TetR family transcriptional regulator [Thermoleophilia bacterium]